MHPHRSRARSGPIALRAGALLLAAVALAACGSTAPRHATTAATVAAPDGVPIAYDVRGSGEPTLVFIHGWACDRQYWTRQVDEFAGSHRVVTLDLPGHGTSGTQRAAWSVDGYGDDVRAVADALGLQRMILVGHSMGGYVALSAAARMPGRVLGVVGVETMQDAEMRYDRAMLAPVLDGLRADFAGTMSGAVDNMLPRDVDPEVETWIVERATSVDPPAAMGVFASMERVDMPALFRGARVPVRCINAVAAPPMTYETKTAVNQRYADFEVQLMPDVGHFPMLEQPRDFNRRLEGVLADLSAGAGG